MVNNLDWTDSMSALDFLRDIGKHFRVSKMLAKDAVSARLTPRPASATPSSATRSCRAWTSSSFSGGTAAACKPAESDQWGNLTAGTDLIRRVAGESVHLLATPLITDAVGAEVRQVDRRRSLWLDPELTSPYACYQYFVNVEDSVVSSRPAQDVHLPRPRGDRGAGEGRRPTGRRPGWRSGGWPRSSPGWCTASTRPSR